MHPMRFIEHLSLFAQKLKKCICYLLRMAVIFMLPRTEAEGMYLLIAHDGCHFHAAKS